MEAATSSAGLSRMSSLLGLKAAPRHGDAHAAEAAVELLAGQVDHPRPAAQVDGVDLAQEAQRLVDAELARRGP
jgi:hypothetical protein